MVYQETKTPGIRQLSDADMEAAFAITKEVKQQVYCTQETTEIRCIVYTLYCSSEPERELSPGN